MKVYEEQSPEWQAGFAAGVASATPAGPAVDVPRPSNVSNPHSSDWHEPGPACDPLIPHYHHKAARRITWDDRALAAGPAVDPSLPRHRYEGDHDCWIAGCDKAAVDVPAALDNETEACRHCPTPEVHPQRIGGGLTYEAEPAALDVERLARALRTYRYNMNVNERSDELARLIAAEYARLQSPDPTGEEEE